jgi:hypothetical protein
MFFCSKEVQITDLKVYLLGALVQLKIWGSELDVDAKNNFFYPSSAGEGRS